MKKKKENNARSLPRKIINFFIGLFAVIVFLALILVGFMQTSTFRDWLKKEIVTQVNSSINGELSIEKLEGTILTSIYLSNISLTTEVDTILSAKSIGLQAQPFDAFLGKIYLNEVIIDQLKLDVHEIEKGVWNIDALSNSPTEEQDTVKVAVEEEDKESSPFPFQVIINDLRFTNLSISKKNYEHLNENVQYQTMETNDLQLNNLTLHAKLAAKFDDLDIRLLVSRLAFNPNFNNFELKDFRGSFILTENFAEVNGLHFVTDDAVFDLTTRMDSVNLFSPLDIEDFATYPVSLKLKVNNFEFDDLSSFLEPITILNGSADLELEAQGKFGDFNVHKLMLEYGNTHFELDGNIKNLNTPAHFIIDANYYNSYADFNDVIHLLHKLDMPQFNNLKLSNFEGTFVGEPTNFHTIGKAVLPEGEIEFDTKLNLQPEVMEYETIIKTKELNFNPVTPLKSNITCIASAKGKGTSPQDLNSEFEFNITNSSLEGYDLQSVYLYAKAEEHIFDIIADATVNNANASFEGDLDFRNQTNPFYNFKGMINSLDISQFTDSSALKSDFNFDFEARGRDLDIDNMIGSFKIELDSSNFRNKEIFGNVLALELNKTGSKRFINFNSDFMDLLVTGEFNITDAIELISYESNTIGDLIEQKYFSFTPINQDSIIVIDEELPAIVKKDIKIDYQFNFKDFSIIQLIIGSETLDIEGRGEGIIKNESNSFTIASEVDLSHFIMVKDGSATYFNDLSSNFHFSRNNQIRKFENLFGSISLTGEKFYSGSEFSNLNLDLVFNHSELFYYFSGDFQNYFATIAEGSFEMTPDRQQINVFDLEVGHNDLWWQNKDTLSISFDSSAVNFHNISLAFDDAEILIDGSLTSDGVQDISIDVNNLSGKTFGKFLAVQGTNNFDSKINFKTKIEGSIYDPIIQSSLLADSIKFKKLDLGKLTTQLDYSDKNIKTAVFLQNKLMSGNSPLISVIGEIPIDLGFAEVDERIPADKEMDLILKTDEFNINAFGDALPKVSEQSGLVNTNIHFSGTLNDPKYEGYINLKEGSFKLDMNNLIYGITGNITLNEKDIVCDKLVLNNKSGTNFPGEILGSGDLYFEGTKLVEANLDLNGNISLMSYGTRVVNPELYGNLFVGTENPWNLNYKNNTITFSGDILLKETDLVYTLKQDEQRNSIVGFNYKILEQKEEVDSARALFLELVSEIRNTTSDSSDNFMPDIDFDYKMNMRTEKEAQLVLNLYKALGQKIIAYSLGNMYMEKTGNFDRAQGSFQLLEGSRMEFIKTFDAVGDLRFESDLTDPYLDVIATYHGNYLPPTNTNSGTTEEVEVRMKVEGPLSQLSNNFGLNSSNISVYLGRDNIEQNIADPKYDESDAISFIIIGKFRDEFTAAEQQNAKNNFGQAFALLSPVISNYFSSATGNIVDDVQISQHGNYTRLGIAGKYGNLRYKFGGTTEELNNLTNANLLLQYYLNRNISARFERKNPVIYYEGDYRKINEFGLRYKFDF